MYRAILVAIFTRFALSQSVTLPEQLPQAVRELRPGSARGELPCQVEALQPALNFASRFQAGYVVRAPMSAYPGGGHHWNVVFSVTPREGSGKPVLFADSIDLPDDASPDTMEEVHGLFLLGEGHYHVKWSILDDLGRIFRKEWDLEAKATGKDSIKDRITMPPGVASDLAWRPTPEAAATASPQRVTLLVNVSRTEGYPWTTLLAMLEPLVEKLSTSSIRLVVFDLPQQRELFREDGFTVHGMNGLVHATNWQTRHVDPGRVWDLLASLVNKEIQSPKPADAVVFVGAPWWINEGMPSGFPKPDKGMTPRFFSVHYSNIYASKIAHGVAGWQGAAPAAFAQASLDQPPAANLFDTIKQTVLRMKGKIFVIQTPAELSKAVEEIARRGK